MAITLPCSGKPIDKVRIRYQIIEVSEWQRDFYARAD